MPTGLYFLQQVYKWFAWENYQSGFTLNLVFICTTTLHKNTNQAKNTVAPYKKT